ncbi:MAG: msrA3 [Gammaproteobacteria bacterium]|jgi:peptide methionine sulfoxide reductase msrA/msrB|nr:msrA3 [Gammaproteobacteria bacterium]
MIDKILSLTPIARDIICNKSTERPFTGEYESFDAPGTYLCCRCGLALFRAEHKFHSGCGWPSFDQEISGAIKQLPDKDGCRTEIVCSRCDAHLGHVFHGEHFTNKNIRHCVNSLSLDFVGDLEVKDTEEAILAAGCFWGVEYLFKQLPGVLKTEVGYSGGDRQDPSYEEICTKQTGHFEVVRIVYDPTKINYESIIKYFFEIHDPTQTNGQGPDYGEQYLSRIFYFNAEQKKTAEKVMQILRDKGYELATELLPVNIFWSAEEYHQDYYAKTEKQPYCHHYVKRF